MTKSCPRDGKQRENCKVRGVALCSIQRKSIRPRGWTTGWVVVSHPRGFSRARVGDRKGGPYETFQWSLVTMGWWFTFIRPAAKSLVCIWSPHTPLGQLVGPHSRCSRTKRWVVGISSRGESLPSFETTFTVLVKLMRESICRYVTHQGFVYCYGTFQLIFVIRVDFTGWLWYSFRTGCRG